MSQKSLVRSTVSLCSCHEVVVYFPCDRVWVSGAGPSGINSKWQDPTFSQENTHIVLK